MRIMHSAAAIAALLIGASVQAAPVNNPAQQSTIKYSTTAGVTSGFGNYARATSTVVYDPSTGTYTIRDTGSLTTKSSFGPLDVDAGASTTEFTVYSKNGGTETFRLLNKSAVALTYVDYGEWIRSATSSGTTSVNDTYLVFGSKTPSASMPRTGSASYTTSYDGALVDKNGRHALDGSGTMSADFAAGTLGYSATINGAPTGSLSFAGSGAISARNGSFQTSTSSGGYLFTQNGNFYGRNAEEIGGLFRMWNRTAQGQGAFVGK